MLLHAVYVAARVINLIMFRKQRDYMEFCSEQGKSEICVYALKCIEIFA
jgi:hypothetical protein